MGEVLATNSARCLSRHLLLSRHRLQSLVQTTTRIDACVGHTAPTRRSLLDLRCHYSCGAADDTVHPARSRQRLCFEPSVRLVAISGLRGHAGCVYWGVDWSDDCICHGKVHSALAS